MPRPTLFFGALIVALAAAGAPTAHAQKLTHPQIAHVAYTAGTIDIEAAKLALQKFKNKDVIAFANDMVRDHEAVNEKALALAKTLKITPEDNDVSRSLASGAEAKRAELAKLDGAAFDKAYATNEVGYHKAVNGALETTLIPAAGNADLKALLGAGLKIFKGHEQHAEHLAGMIKGGDGSFAPKRRSWGARSRSPDLQAPPR
jgi:putative membrane protein